jgi:hypothetical protein
MNHPLVIDLNECRGLMWRPPAGLEFAGHRHLIPLHAGELARAAATMPLALVKTSHEWRLMGVCGMKSGHNLFIKNGKWLGGYCPQWLSTWPFEVVEAGNRGLVTFDRDSGLLEAVHDDRNAEPFFDADGQPGPALARVLKILEAYHAKQAVTKRAIAALVDAKILAPWPESILSELGINLPGLHRVDEQAMARLDDQAFLSLRKARSLPLAYALNLSLPQAHLLARLERINPSGAPLPADLGRYFDGDDNLTFDFDR